MEWVLGFSRNRISSVELVSQVSLAVLNGLVDVLGRTESPSPDTVRQSSLLKLSAKVNVRVTHRAGFQGQVLIDFAQDGHRVVVDHQDVINIAEYISVVSIIVVRSSLSLVP